MSGYGYRLYTVKLVSAARKSKAIEFDKCGASGDEHVSVWVRRALTLLESYGPFTGAPHQLHAVDEDGLPEIETYVVRPTRGQYRTNFVGHTKAPVTRIRFSLEYGRTGKVSVGVTDDGSIPLDHIPTGDRYRGILYLPPTGTLGLLALESVPSAPNPQRMMNAWLARAAVDLAAEDLARVTDENREAVRPQAFKLNFNQYPNIDRIEKAVQNNPAAKVVLRREHIDGQGIPSDDQIVLSSTLRSQKKKNAAAKVAGNLVRKVTGQLAEDEEPVTVEALEELVDGSLEGIEWTEGYIQIDDASGLKKIGLEKIDKFFVYPIGSSVPLNDKKFEMAVAKEVVSLQSVLGLDLDL